ncbi:unnamed protein product [Effrenium voratum]|nr:unnamed protein product [Effrenium voratum]|mmetsp:Transcript_118765/g.281832  ORF Transcript_118765/g.281832 Transcript_118765/m.281832 type:complete len:156 (+) Transcript_118765:62-529(+)
MFKLLGALLLAADATRVEHLDQLNGTDVTGSCPSTAHPTTGRWIAYGRGVFGHHWQYMNCEKCNTVAGSGVKACGSRGTKAGGGYTYGDEGQCRNAGGCLCTEKRQAGNANSGFTMVKSCHTSTFKSWMKCCDSTYSKCCSGTDCDLECPAGGWR